MSVSAWSRRTEKRQDVPEVCERDAARLLRGAGGDREWWHWNADGLIGHLRVGLTPAEYATLPPMEAIDDAGETGPERPRSNRNRTGDLTMTQPPGRDIGREAENTDVKPTYGHVAYNGYRKASNGKSLVTGTPIPPWDGMPEAIRDAWDAAAGEVIFYYNQLGQET